MNIKQMAHEVQEKVVAFRHDLHKHPEASLQEFRTTKQIAAALDQLGVSYRLLDPTGLVAEIKGGKPGKTVALRADIDALSIQEKTDCEFKSINDGMMHACGHDTHASMLLGAVTVINQLKDQISGNVRFIFQPAEEVAKGAKLAVAQGAIEGADAIFGIHVSVMTPVGRLQSCPGPICAATDIYKVTIKGKACHGAAPHTGMDATVCGAAMVMNLQTMVSREFSPMEPLVVTVGSFHSGSRFNIVSGEAVLEGTIRSFNPELHAQIPGVLKRICEKTAETYRCEAVVEYEAITEVTVNDPAMFELGMEAARKVSGDVMQCEKATGGEDFSEYTKVIPGAFFRLGCGGNWPGHSDHYEVDESSFETGVAFHVQVALDFLAK